jgi:hypothetical protein
MDYTQSHAAHFTLQAHSYIYQPAQVHDSLVADCPGKRYIDETVQSDAHAYIHIHTFIYTYTSAYTHTYMHSHKYVHARMHAYMQLHALHLQRHQDVGNEASGRRPAAPAATTWTAKVPALRLCPACLPVRLCVCVCREIHKYTYKCKCECTLTCGDCPALRLSVRLARCLSG